MHMDEIERLVIAAKRLGYGVDLNFIHNTFSVTMPRGKQKFDSVTKALAFVEAKQKVVDAFMNR